MAIYHLSSQIISRAKGRSAVAAAAYRSGERLLDERTGLVHDYTRKQGIAETFIEAPENAPSWVSDRQELWNAVESKERRKDSQLCRELDIALPVELSEAQQTELLRGYVREQFAARGMVADVAIHRGDRGNPHAHVMLTMRGVGPEGFEGKDRSWNDRQLHQEWRRSWERHANRELERVGSFERIDHRSHEDRGIDRAPTVHEGPDVREMEARGIRTDRGELNRRVQERDHRRDRLQREADRPGVSREDLERQEERRQKSQRRGKRERERRGDDRDHDLDRDL